MPLGPDTVQRIKLDTINALRKSSLNPKMFDTSKARMIVTEALAPIAQEVSSVSKAMEKIKGALQRSSKSLLKLLED